MSDVSRAIPAGREGFSFATEHSVLASVMNVAPIWLNLSSIAFAYARAGSAASRLMTVQPDRRTGREPLVTITS